MKINLKTIVVVVISLVGLFLWVPLWADDTRGKLDPNRLNDAESTVARAADVYKALIKEGRVPQSVLANSQCIVVFPSIVTAAAAIGGVHGDGIAFCRNAEAKWSNPVFLDLTGASIGLQAGVKSTDIVMYMTAASSREAIQKGDTALMGDLSAVAGSFEESFVAPKSGVLVYGRTGGAFIGALVSGVKLSRDEDEQRAFYGSYDPSNVFEGRIPPKVAASVEELRRLLPS